MNITTTVEHSLNSLIHQIIKQSITKSVRSLSRVGINIKSSLKLTQRGIQTTVIANSARVSRTTPFDMKLGFARSRKRHHTKDGGWYLNISFRHKTTSMPRNIYDQAKQLSSGGSLTVNGSAGNSWTGYGHKDNKYDGLRRMVNSTYGKYYTFRRVSNNSDPLSWWHPGFESATGRTDQQVIQKTVSDFIVANIKSALRR